MKNDKRKEKFLRINFYPYFLLIWSVFMIIYFINYIIKDGSVKTMDAGVWAAIGALGAATISAIVGIVQIIVNYKTNKQNNKRTDDLIYDEEGGLFHRTDNIQKTVERIDGRTEEMSKDLPKDLTELASAARATTDALKKSFDEERTNAEVLADVQKALSERDYYLHEFKALSNELDEKNREIRELKDDNKTLKKRLSKYEREPEDDLEL